MGAIESSLTGVPVRTTPEGWRVRRRSGRVLMERSSGADVSEIVCAWTLSGRRLGAWRVPAGETSFELYGLETISGTSLALTVGASEGGQRILLLP